MTKLPSPLVAFVPIVIMVVLLYFAISTFGSDALNGASQIVLLVVSAICVLIGMLFYKVEWQEFENDIVRNIKDC